VELPSCRMLTLGRYESVNLGEKNDQTSAGNFVSDFDPSPTAGSKEITPFNALPFCISAVASNRILTT